MAYIDLDNDSFIGLTGTEWQEEGYSGTDWQDENLNASGARLYGDSTDMVEGRRGPDGTPCGAKTRAFGTACTPDVPFARAQGGTIHRNYSGEQAQYVKDNFSREELQRLAASPWGNDPGWGSAGGVKSEAQGGHLVPSASNNWLAAMDRTSQSAVPSASNNWLAAMDRTSQSAVPSASNNWLAAMDFDGANFTQPERHHLKPQKRTESPTNINWGPALGRSQGTPCGQKTYIGGTACGGEYPDGGVAQGGQLKGTSFHDPMPYRSASGFVNTTTTDRGSNAGYVTGVFDAKTPHQASANRGQFSRPPIWWRNAEGTGKGLATGSSGRTDAYGTPCGQQNQFSRTACTIDAYGKANRGAFTDESRFTNAAGSRLYGDSWTLNDAYEGSGGRGRAAVSPWPPERGSSRMIDSEEDIINFQNACGDGFCGKPPRPFPKPGRARFSNPDDWDEPHMMY